MPLKHNLQTKNKIFKKEHSDLIRPLAEPKKRQFAA